MFVEGTDQCGCDNAGKPYPACPHDMRGPMGAVGQPGLRVNNKLWLWSDTHFGHKNIIKYEQRPESHEAIMLSNWIDRVGENDTILHLGDVFIGKHGSPTRWAKIIARMPGLKFLILGNHDILKEEIYRLAGFHVIRPFVHEGVAFTHRPISPDFPFFLPEEKMRGVARKAWMLNGWTPDAGFGWHTNVHGHIHGQTLEEAAERHGESAVYPDRKYINVCVEVQDLAPRQLGSIHPL